MNPLTLEFKEIPTATSLDFSQIEYNEQLNLSVSKLTGLPAIDEVTMDTETFTKAEGEASDSDDNGIRMLTDTEMITLVSGEGTVSDRDRATMQALMETSTLTESTEATDQDKDWK